MSLAAAINGPSILEALGAWPARGQSWLSRETNKPGSVEDAFSDQALVESIVGQGNQEHFRTLVARYKSRVHGIVLSVLGPAHATAAEDVAQEVFIRLYQRLHTFRAESSFSTWLYRLAMNQAIDHHRRNRRHLAERLDAVPEMAADDSASDGWDEHRRRQQVAQAVELLPSSQRVMVHLHYWLGYKLREIGELLGCPENTVKVYVSRARHKLAQNLEGQALEP